MHEAWFNAFLPESQTVCLGITLREYCLGHEILLTRIQSPVLGSDDPEWLLAIPQHLSLAVLICSQDFASARKTLRNPFLALFMRLWRLRLRRPDWTAELRKFLDYRSAGMFMPEVNPPATYKILKSPWPFRVAAILMDKFHCTEEQALNFPMARAHCYYAAWGEMEGTVDPYGASDEAMLKKVEEMDGPSGLPPSGGQA